ncbi:indolepyruvate ferredoxin oxidoreductase family protein [Ferrovibrio sp.]|uniref:indolepyruvate ferredoxin oxidoreductase family protein n=1 Tax=Ferrovibrio sp. TaxID=1917215 RepID=UPI0025B8830A|nr:indolepyruvate ferredoxin oxidoreductase family protein [Ferrovibrio sp.]MBX3455945.1 indolepyruvate ferredoxin oxidoreductase family protein [Ferrovibrio sp.]
MLTNVTLDDKYTLEKGRVFLTGTQALVRLPMLQRKRDELAGLNTGCFISGYRGSPLGMYDQQLWRARKFLKSNHVHFQPGLNEDMAATSVWGSQQVGMFPGANYDGVFGIWYGKGPGVDRAMDVFKHANSAGTSKHGGVLALCGDDHGAASSTLAHQSEHMMMAAMIPMLNPASVQEFLDYGLLGWAMSRYAGVWVGFKCQTETVESSASVSIDPERLQIKLPENFQMPPGGLNIRWPDGVLEQELRLQQHKAYAALAFARANQIDRVTIDSPRARLGIITTGKSYLDVRQALDELGIDEKLAAEIGIRVYKVGMVWPLEREGARHFAEGLEEVLVVEEKRAMIENQLKEQLYNWREDVRPRVVGKFDEQGQWILPSAGEITPAMVAKAIHARLKRFYTNPLIEERIAFLLKKEQEKSVAKVAAARTPYFCSGCPHNTSTRVPEGSRAAAGIGCHFMALWMNRETATFTQMGGEGVPWVGQAPFTDEKHIFANLGDGTYFHSGLLAIRQSIAAKVNITYKILYNDAVAMTGGQPHDGQLTPPAITQQVYGEGVKKIIVVTDEPDKYPIGTPWAPGVTIRHRDELDTVQRELREIEGCTVLVYDQTCAAEKRRRRKRGTFPDPQKRAFINDAVCEGCGDCSVKSNCVSVEPLETELGRKRKINQSSCNKDFSCVNGFCPSFVTVHGGKVKRAKVQAGRQGPSEADIVAMIAALPKPETPSLTKPYNILITGIGGTGVVTIGQILGMGAHIQGFGTSVLDFTGLAQKNGAVLSHIRIAKNPDDIHAVRVASGGADLLLGCDMVVAAGTDALDKLHKGVTRAVVNSHLTPTAAFTLNPNMKFNTNEMMGAIRDASGANLAEFLEATRIATALMGDAIATNMFMLGYAVQRGLIPVPLDALEKAIELNGAAVDSNLRALGWGRLFAQDPKTVEMIARPAIPVAELQRFASSTDEILADRYDRLVKYQDRAYADRYKALVETARTAETEKAKGFTGLAEAVARYGYKLMAYKDEYEVARLYTDGDFLQKLNAQFEGDFSLEFHLAPPLLAHADPQTGLPKKMRFGPWMLKAFGLLAKFKGLRGGKLDIFGYTEERRMERKLIAEYAALIQDIASKLTPDNHALAIQLASIPEDIRGYGHVKLRHLQQARDKQAKLLEAFRNPAQQASAAE